ncbi:hypothetical protein TWF481_008003 [Arthrobotrys musiformis]|uniref:Polycomb protein VEFS-Box domain-containing protein n=1 Tax=Arthrobotrys musiformis TaxID=47236 RepID=A0AAV9W7M5_9PEZI
MRRKNEPTYVRPGSMRSRTSGIQNAVGTRLRVSTSLLKRRTNNNNNNNTSGYQPRSAGGNSNNNTNTTFPSNSLPPLTLSDAYQGNLLLYNLFAKYAQKVFLERNISRILNDQARLLKAENEGRRVSRRYWNRDGRTRKMSEIVRRLGVVPEFDDDVVFGVNVEVVSGFPKGWIDHDSCECEMRLFAMPSASLSSWKTSSRSRPQEEGQGKRELLRATEAVKVNVSRTDSDATDQQVFGTKRPFMIPLSSFAIEDASGKRFASSGYEVSCRIGLRGDTGGEEGYYEACLRLDENLVCNDGLDKGVVTTVKAGGSDLDPDSESPKLKIGLRWNKDINYRIVKNDGEKKKKEQRQQRMSNTNLPSKRRKQIRIDYTFRGHVKNFDDKDAHKNSYTSTVNLNNKLYVFNYQGNAYTCVICQNTTFQSLDRLRFHLLHTHTYFTCSLEAYAKHKDHVKILVEPAVEEGRRFSQPPGNNDRKFLWIRPKGLGDRAFNLEEYLKGDTTWARGVAVPEAERKLMNAPGRMLRKMQIVPELSFGIVEKEKRRCVVAGREDGKGYVRFLTGERVVAGDEVSESGDEIDEGWVAAKVNEKIDASGFSSAGREFLKLWGGHVAVEGPRSNHHLHDCLIRFCRQNKKTLKAPSLRQEFDKFVAALRLRGQVDRVLVKECKRVLDSTL